MVEDKKEDKQPNNFEILNLKIFGIDFGELIKNWTGADIQTLIEKPEQLEHVKEKIEEQRIKLLKAQEQLNKKYGDAIRFDYDIRIGSLIGGQKEIRIGGGKFFQNLDEATRARTKYRQTPTMRIETPKEQDVREPLSDISEREGYLFITAELPGVNEQDIKVKVIDDKITISTDAQNKKYHTEITLPTKVSPIPIGQTYKNGVLEVKLKKKE